MRTSDQRKGRAEKKSEIEKQNKAVVDDGDVLLVYRRGSSLIGEQEVGGILQVRTSWPRDRRHIDLELAHERVSKRVRPVGDSS